MKPMLFHSASMADMAAYMTDDDWALQQKVDGMRCMVRLGDFTCDFLTRDGRELKSAAAKLHFPKFREVFLYLRESLFMHGDEMILDAELMTDTGQLVVFDLPRSTVQGYSADLSTSQIERWRALSRLVVDQSPAFVRLVSTAYSSADKLALVQWLEATGAEGLIAKRTDSPYEPGQRVKHSLKLKFTQTADVIVLDVDRGESKHSKRGGDKLNYVVGCWNGEHYVEVATVSRIGKEEVQKGDIIEVEYLYQGAGHRLVQPRMVRPRPDKQPWETHIDQLKVYSKEVR